MNSTKCSLLNAEFFSSPYVPNVPCVVELSENEAGEEEGVAYERCVS